ncbi:hypothetical protein C7410_10826 [Paraburkholderia silvatlantica]|uniref:Uncharacterized protein n=1 Tax=Paraburkholderia silvatlantica TaxID=321895 RepID=A0A2V4TH79_9BURK|nr:hypothetical protein C7410_10826 [Paraburkholderia silvatlantica]
MRHGFENLALSPGNGKQRQMTSNVFVDVLMPQLMGFDETPSRVSQIPHPHEFPPLRHNGVERIRLMRVG